MGTRRDTRPSRQKLAAGVTRATLREAPQRVLQLLTAYAENERIRLALAQTGFDEAEHRRGRALLDGLLQQRVLGDLPTTSARSAAALDAWMGDGLRLLEARLTRFPEARAELLEGIDRRRLGGKSVLAVKKILERVEELAASADPTHQAVLAVLEAGVLPTALRAELHRAVVDVMTPAPVRPVGETVAAYDAALVALRDFHQEWAGVARMVLTRRDDLVRAGVASPGRPKKEA